MSNAQLVHVLGYIWAFFGAYWMGIAVLRRELDGEQKSSRVRHFAFLAATFTALFVGRHRIPPALLLIFGLAWALLGTRWGSPGTAALSAEFKWYRPLRLLILAAVFSLLFWNATSVGVLGKRFIPDIPALGIVGFFATSCGMGVALWSRIVLGRYWSDKVILQTEHRLIRGGPYSCMRHPLYSGVLLAVVGTALVVGEWRGLVSFAVLLANYAIKAKREERILAERFGADFAVHAARTGFLLPRIRRA